MPLITPRSPTTPRPFVTIPAFRNPSSPRNNYSSPSLCLSVQKRDLLKMGFLPSFERKRQALPWPSRHPSVCPAQKHAASRVPSAHADDEHQVALVQASLFHRIAQAQGNRPCRGVAIPVDVHHHLAIVDSEPFLRRSDDAQIGLVGHQQLEAVPAKAIFFN